MLSLRTQKANGIKLVIAILILLGYSLLFQGTRGLWEKDEGRYTCIALQMLRSGNYLRPMLNDDTPHYAKPPFSYWAISLGIRGLGRNEWGARVPNSLAFVATILLIYYLARSLNSNDPWLAPMIYATCLLPFVAENYINSDTFLTLWETLGVLGFVRSFKKGGEVIGRSNIYMMWLGFSLAFLTKGPPSLLPLLPIFLTVYIYEGRAAIWRLLHPLGLFIFLVIGLGWFIFIAATSKGAFSYFLIDEFLRRIGTGFHHRNPEWYKPFVIYMPTLAFGLLPWNVIVLKYSTKLRSVLFSNCIGFKRIFHDRWNCFLLLWIFIPMAIFFVSRSRLPLYILPLCVPIAIVFSKLLEQDFSKLKHRKQFVILWVLTLLLLKCLGGLYPYEKDSREFSKYLISNVMGQVKEVVFVDEDPFWGISLYLDCEVEEVCFEKCNIFSKLETLEEELKENESNLVYISKSMISEYKKKKISANLLKSIVLRCLHRNTVYLTFLKVISYFSER